MAVIEGVYCRSKVQVKVTGKKCWHVWKGFVTSNTCHILEQSLNVTNTPIPPPCHKARCHPIHITQHYIKLYWNIWFKNTSCTSTIHADYVYKHSLQSIEKWKRSSLHKLPTLSNNSALCCKDNAQVQGQITLKRFRVYAQKIRLAHLLSMLMMYTKYNCNPSKTEGGVCSTNYLPYLTILQKCCMKNG